MTAPIEGTGQSAGAGAQGGSQTDGNTAGATGTTADANAQSGAATGEKTYTQADFDAMRNQLSAADRAREAAQQESKRLKDAQLSVEEKTKQDLEEQKAENAKLAEANKLLQLQNAFVTDNTYDWHDPKAALKLADLTAVTVDDGGTVKGLKEALKAVADSNPWMIKPKANTEETPGANAVNNGAGTGGSTGVGGQGSSSANRGSANKNELEKRFPQLRGRTS